MFLLPIDIDNNTRLLTLLVTIAFDLMIKIIVRSYYLPGCENDAIFFYHETTK